MSFEICNPGTTEALRLAKLRVMELEQELRALKRRNTKALVCLDSLACALMAEEALAYTKAGKLRRAGKQAESNKSQSRAAVYRHCANMLVEEIARIHTIR